VVARERDRHARADDLGLIAKRKSMQKSRPKKLKKARSGLKKRKMKPTVLSPLRAHQANFDRKWILLDFEKLN